MLKKQSIAILINALGIIISLAVNVVLARSMGLVQYGSLGLSLAIIILYSMVIQLGISSIIPRYVAVAIGEEDLGQAKKLSLWSIVVILLLSLIFSFISYTYFYDIAANYGLTNAREGIVLLSCFIPSMCLLSISCGLLKAYGKNMHQVLIETLLLNLFILIFAVGGWFYSNSLSFVLVGYGFSYLLAAVFALLAVIVFYRRLPSKKPLNNVPLKELVSQSIPLVLAGMSQRVFRRSDAIIVGSILGESAVGLYKAAYTISSGIAQLVTPVKSFALRSIGFHHGKKDEKTTKWHFDLSIRFGMLITLPLVTLIVPSAEVIVRTVFGDEYLESIILLQILASGFSLFGAVGAIGVIFNVMKANWYRFWVVFVIALLNVCANIWLVKLIGLTGAALSTSISFVLLYVVMRFIMNLKLGYDNSFTPLYIWFLAILFAFTLAIFPIISPLVKSLIALPCSLLVFVLLWRNLKFSVNS